MDGDRDILPELDHRYSKSFDLEFEVADDLEFDAFDWDADYSSHYQQQ